MHTANTYSSWSYHFSHDTWLSSATPLSRAGHSGIWLMLSPSVVICLICTAFWEVSKTSLNVSQAHSQLVSTWLAGWYLPHCFSPFLFIFFPLSSCLYLVFLWISVASSLFNTDTEKRTAAMAASEKRSLRDAFKEKHNSWHLLGATYYYHEVVVHCVFLFSCCCYNCAFFFLSLLFPNKECIKLPGTDECLRGGSLP